MAQSFETWLYNKCNAVYLHGFTELASNITLLDVLVKTGSEGLLTRRPVLSRAGSMTDLGTGSSVKILREGLDDFERKDPKGGDGLFYMKDGGQNIDESFASTGSLSSSLCSGPVGELNSHFSQSKNLAVKVEGLSTACVRKDKLVEYVTANNQWKPNVEDLRLGWSHSRMSRWLKKGPRLWIIHEILYASKLEIKSGVSMSVGAKVATVAPGSPGADISISGEGTNVINLTVGTNPKIPGKFMFAFRAICLRFDSIGRITDRKENAGEQMPICKTLTYRDEDELSYDEAAELRELFLDEPPEDVEEEDEDEEEGDSDTLIKTVEVRADTAVQRTGILD